MPSGLRKTARIEDDVVIVAFGDDYFEVWSKYKWELEVAIAQGLIHGLDTSGEAEGGLDEGKR